MEILVSVVPDLTPPEIEQCLGGENRDELD